MRAVRLLAFAVTLPLAACVEVLAPETAIVDQRCTARRVYVPSTVDAALTGYDCTTDDATESFVDHYELRITQTQWVDLYLESFDFDAYLMIFDEWDELVTADDDSGDSTDAWITVRLPPGRYYIAATSHAGGETGAYRLFVE